MERFTERARQVIILAREEAGRFRHDFVGTAHLLLGLIRDGECVATAALQRLGLGMETVKAEVERRLAGFPKALTFGEVPFMPQATWALELGVEEARQLGHDYIGTEHLLLGLMKGGVAAEILHSLGARLYEVRQETLALLGDESYARYLETRATRTGAAVQRDIILDAELPPRVTGVGSRDGEEIIGDHPQMQKIARLVTQAARTTTTVLISGEVGTGKDLIARAIHHRGPRSDKPFVPVGPSTIPDALVESELFGHEKGAFTGALQRKLGCFELAQGGTLVLGQVGLLRLDLQSKLLRVLQEREIQRVGGTRSIKIDVRIVATDYDLMGAVGNGNFRKDLYYGLSVVPIPVPPLRERREDVPLLTAHYVRRFAAAYRKPMRGVQGAAVQRLIDEPWPGNVRQLVCVLERAVVLAERDMLTERDVVRAEGDTLTERDLREARQRQGGGPRAGAHRPRAPAGGKRDLRRRGRARG